VAGVMRVPGHLPPVRGWEKKLPRRRIRCLLGRHKIAEFQFTANGCRWAVYLSACAHCKRPLEVKARRRWQ
jgi:hypothetical protein